VYIQKRKTAKNDTFVTYSGEDPACPVSAVSGTTLCPEEPMYPVLHYLWYLNKWRKAFKGRPSDPCSPGEGAVKRCVTTLCYWTEQG